MKPAVGHGRTNPSALPTLVAQNAHARSSEADSFSKNIRVLLNSPNIHLPIANPSELYQRLPSRKSRKRKTFPHTRSICNCGVGRITRWDRP